MQHNGIKKLAHEVIIAYLKDLVSQIKEMDLIEGPENKNRYTCEVLIQVLGAIKMKPEHRNWALTELEKLAPGLDWEDLNQVIAHLQTGQKIDVIVGLLGQIRNKPKLCDEYLGRLEQMVTNHSQEGLDQMIAQLRTELENVQTEQ